MEKKMFKVNVTVLAQVSVFHNWKIGNLEDFNY